MKHTRRVESALGSVVAKYEVRHGEAPRGACQVEGVEPRTPYDELAAKDDAAARANALDGPALPGLGGHSGRSPFEELETREGELAAEGGDATAIALETTAWLLDFIFAQGPHPALAMRRLYCLVKKLRPSLIWDAGYRDMGKLFGETGAAVEWRMGVVVDEYLQARGVKNTKVGWERTAEACREYSRVQEDNDSRLGGKRSGKSKRKSKQKKK